MLIVIILENHFDLYFVNFIFVIIESYFYDYR